MNISKNWLQTFPHSGVVFCYQPQKCTLKGKSLKIPIHLHCLIPPPKKKKWVITSSLTFFCSFVCFQVATFWKTWRPPRSEPSFWILQKLSQGFSPSTNQKGNHWSLFFESFHVQKMIRGPNFEVYQGCWFPMVTFCMVHPHRLSRGDWKLILPVWSVCVIQVTRIFTYSKFTIQK